MRPRLVILSFAIHAAIAAVLLRAPVRGMTERDASLTPDTIEIATVDEPPAAVEEQTFAAAGTTSRVERGVTTAHERSGAHAAPLASGEASAGTGRAEVPAAEFVVPIMPPDIGVGGPTRFVGNAARGVFAEETEEEKRSAAQRAIQNALVEADRVKGLGPEGPVIGALRDGTSRSLAPITGRAVFTVKANAEGEVTAVEVTDDRSGGPGWDDAARVALEELRGRKLRMPPRARGLSMRFEVVSSMTYASGQKHALEFGARNEDGPALVLPDESNIGQRPSRRIRTRSLSTEVL